VSGYPLDGVRILDLSQYVAGPYCTQVLADLGADVLKVERPARGDVYRAQGPVFANGESASFLTLNRGKRSLELDFASEEGRARVRELAHEADVLVENMRPGALAKHGLDYDSFAASHPRLVYCSISAFGQVGPRASEGGYDVTIQALSGLMAAAGHPGERPVKIPVAAIDFGSALYAVVGILAALAERERSGRGQWVQTSLFECALAWLSMHIVTVLLGGEEPTPAGTRSPFFAPYEAYRTRDGFLVVVGTGGSDAWERLCRVLRLEALIDDPRFATNADRVRNAEALRSELEAVLEKEQNEHWVSVLTSEGIACAPVQPLSRALDDAQARALAMVTMLDHPTAGRVPSVRLPVTLSTARTTATAPPPLLGHGGGDGFRERRDYAAS
jgi:crotonobetainyl-CoA:carnitine CoA-transferase CaiB-like acyl-CoA transferase